MKNFKRLVAASLAATMALALSVSAFAEVEVKDAVKAAYADGKAAYTETINAKDGTQMTVAIFKALDQDEDLSAEKLEYINQDVNTALNLSAMGTKNNLLAEDNEGKATYAGDYVIRVGYYDDNNAWQYAEGTFTVATKAAASTPDTITIKWGDINCNGSADTGDAKSIMDTLIGGSTTFGSEGEYKFNQAFCAEGYKWGDINCNGSADTGDAKVIMDTLIGGGKTFGPNNIFTLNVETTLNAITAQ